jgi:hypothetical protein
MAGQVGNIRVDNRVIMLFNGHSSLATWKDRITNTTGLFFNGITYSDGGLTGDGVNDYFTYNVDITPAFTYTIVAKSATSTWNTYAGLGSSRVSNGFIFDPNINTTSIRTHIYNSTGAVSNTSYVDSLLYVNNIQENNIYTISINSNAVSRKMYINGVLAQDVTLASSIVRTSSTIELSILRDHNIAGRYTAGNVKYISMYNEQLTDGEVYDLHSIIRKQIPL